MNMSLSAFDHISYPTGAASRPLARLAARQPLSLVVAGISLPSPCFALKDSDPLRAKARVESYAAVARPDAPSSMTIHGY